jgi:heat shock protein HslJ
MKHTHRWILALVTVVAVALLGVGYAAQAAGRDSGQTLAGSKWVLGSMGQGQAVFDGTVTTLEIGAAYEVHGSAGCNRYMGTLEVDGDTLTFGPVGATMMMCPGEIMDQETEYLQALGSASTFEIGADGLHVSYAGGVLTFVPAG